ncbi:MAG: helix-turn-helix transcriptional regulator [Bdellovibrionaceae bacterium]|nr:helix-turn-helix transcriptional regulator [Pseudobdellovibrionaceae bacterium]
MDAQELSIKHRGKTNTKVVTKDVIVLRRMRIVRKVNRNDAAKAIERSVKSIERFENGRSNLSTEQKKILVRRYRFTWQEFLAYLDGQCDLPDLPSRSTYPSKEKPREDGRKYQKVISKEARVLKVMRKMAGLTQPEAGAKCDMHRSCIDHLENGRVEITREKIEHVVRSYGFKMYIFEELLEAPMLRDEVLQECLKILTVLDNEKLRAVKALLDNFR